MDGMKILSCLPHTLEVDNQILRQALAAIGEAVFATDRHGCIRYINPAAAGLVGYGQDEALGRKLNNVLSLSDGVQPIAIPELSSLETRASTKFHLPEDTVLESLSGRKYQVNGVIVPSLDMRGTISGMVAVLSDMSSLRQVEEKLVFQATHDALTGLVNRGEFEQRLRALLDRDEPESCSVLLYLDLDEFKIINDTCGHVAGDALLRQINDILRIRIRQTDTLARLGGDEFGVLLENCPVGEGQRIAELICWAIQDLNFEWEGKSSRTSVSIGMVPIQRWNRDATSLMRDADSACFAAKEAGRNQVHVFGESDRELGQHAGQMFALSTLHNAVAHNQFTLYAQPIIPTTSVTGELAHLEILLRMHDQQGNIVLPGAFLPAAERHHQMPLIDRWVVSSTLDLLNRLQISNRYTFAINLSGQSIGRSDFQHFVMETLDQKHIDPRHICFEITEGAAITNLNHADSFITVMRALGCRFALDDFGVGMSSLTYLRRLPIDYLKIDGSFIRNIAFDPINDAMVRAVQHVARVTGVKTIAESVESVTDLRVLQEIGIDLVQGYLIAEPMPLEELCELDFTELERPLSDVGDLNVPC